MASYNKIILLGNLTRDPQLSYCRDRTPVCEFGMAVSRRWKDKDGQQREDVCFIDCRCYGKSAEAIAKYMTKGRSLLVEGRLELDQWEDQNGQKRSKHRVNVEQFQFMDSRQGGERDVSTAPRQATATPPDAQPFDDDENSPF
jgi:single-strand DNA-binding protein